MLFSWCSSNSFFSIPGYVKLILKWVLLHKQDVDIFGNIIFQYINVDSTF